MSYPDKESLSWVGILICSGLFIMLSWTMFMISPERESKEPWTTPDYIELEPTSPEPLPLTEVDLYPKLVVLPNHSTEKAIRQLAKLHGLDPDEEVERTAELNGFFSIEQDFDQLRLIELPPTLEEKLDLPKMVYIGLLNPGDSVSKIAKQLDRNPYYLVEIDWNRLRSLYPPEISKKLQPGTLVLIPVSGPLMMDQF